MPADRTGRGRATDADLAVVGGGIVGAAIAFGALTDRPGGRVVILDQGVRDTATRWSLGVLAPWAATPGQRALLERGAARRHDPAVLRLIRPHLRQVPVLVVAAADTLEGLARSTVGAAMEPASPALVETARDACGEPALRPGDGLATVRGGMAVMDTPAATASLKDAVAGTGGSVLSDARVVRVEAHPAGGQRLTLTDGTVITANSTALATGPWPGPEVTPGHASAGPDVVHGPGADGRGRQAWRTKRMAALHVDRDLPPHAPMVCFPDDDLFLLPAGAGAGLPGGAWASFRSDRWDLAPDDGGAAFDDHTLDEGLRVLRRRLPGLGASARAGRLGIDGYTPDRTPLIDRPAPGVVRATAASGGGARFCWGMADQALEILSR